MEARGGIARESRRGDGVDAGHADGELVESIGAGESAAQTARPGEVDSDVDGLGQECAHRTRLGPARVSDMADDGQSVGCKNALLCPA